MAKVTILLQTKTRDELKAIGRKDQTYDQLIVELITERHHQHHHQLKQNDEEKVGLVCL
ncbi:MAG TPA: hypothetical protein VH796_02315 [Nitrososphaeraceae archaeon]|jgi:hypothetical protein